MKVFYLLLTVLLNAGVMVQGRNLIENGGFEDSLVVYSTYPDWPANSWISWWEGVGIDSSIVHTGDRSLKISTADITGSGFVHYEMTERLSEYELSFWVYPGTAEYENVFVLGADWINYSSYRTILRIAFGSQSIKIFGLNNVTVAGNRIVPGKWNNIRIATDKTGTEQTVMINGDIVATVLKNAADGFDVVSIGDYTRKSLYGTVYYDDVTITHPRGESFEHRNDAAAHELARHRHGNDDRFEYSLNGTRILPGNRPGMQIRITEDGRAEKKYKD